MMEIISVPLLESMQEFQPKPLLTLIIYIHRDQSGLNKQTMEIIGVPLLESMQEFQLQLYKAFVNIDNLHPQRPVWTEQADDGDHWCSSAGVHAGVPTTTVQRLC